MAAETVANEATGVSDETSTAVACDEDLLEILRQYDGSRGGLVALLQAIQARYGYLPEAVLRGVSQRTGCSLVDLYGVATFYRSFSLQPRGEHLVCACMGTACHVRGGGAVLEHFERKLGISAGQTSADGEYTLERVNCLGACALAPLVVADGRYFGQMNETKANAVLETLKPAPASADGPEAGG